MCPLREEKPVKRKLRSKTRALWRYIGCLTLLLNLLSPTPPPPHLCVLLSIPPMTHESSPSAFSLTPSSTKSIHTDVYRNLPGWRWAGIKQLALVGSSSSLHSEACKALGGSDGVVHSRISGSGDLRSRSCQPSVSRIRFP